MTSTAQSKRLKSSSADDVNDVYLKRLADWSSSLADLDDLQRPPKPPLPDRRKGCEALRLKREAAYQAAFERWTALHDRWAAANDVRKAKLRAERETQRDWKLVKSKRTVESWCHSPHCRYVHPGGRDTMRLWPLYTIKAHSILLIM